jgi:murein DD-endopeptidase MepM/ murein hydrolase activator NlpD
LFQRNTSGLGSSASTAALSMDQAIAPARNAFRTHHRSGFFSLQDLAPDLGTDIFSKRWFRGVITLLGLCTLTLYLSPGIRPLHAAVDAPISGRALDEARAQSIAPLAWGADTGKRMAATNLVTPTNDTPERPSVEFTATLGQGDGFMRVLERAGVSPQEARLVNNMVAGVADVNAIAPGTMIPIVLGARINKDSPRPLQSLAMRAAFDLKISITRGPNGLQINPVRLAVDRAPMRIRGRVGQSLYHSLRGAGVPGTAIETYIRAIADRVSFDTDLHSNAVFDLVFENARAETGETMGGKLLYAGFDNGSTPVRMIQWTVGGQSGWHDAIAATTARVGMIQPVAGARLSSGFGMRFHPILGYARLHRGVDYAAPSGAPIRAIADGIVSSAGWAGGYGLQVKVNHTGNLMTSSSHMSRIMVYNGQRVTQGQLIGYVGSTGLSTGPHLHFETYKGNTLVNPQSVTFSQPALLNGPELAAFKARMNAMLSIPVSGAN